MELVEKTRFTQDYNSNTDYDVSLAFNALDDGICIIDADDYIVEMNLEFKRLTGVKHTQVKHFKFYRIVNNSMILKLVRSRAENEINIISQSGTNYRIVTRLIFDAKRVYQGMILKACKKHVDENKVVRMTPPMHLKNPYKEIITRNDVLIKELMKAHKASKSNATIIINGESGTGKELLANAIHSSSKRSEHRFVAVNCGAIPENLFESHLFGHTKGAFTGAIQDKIGKIEYANGGTLFLDEIGELPLNMQVKLLRVIQERKVSKIGSNKVQSIDVRIIAATNRDLKEMVREGSFREDLYYRLNVIPIDLISLRERNNDIPLLLEYFKTLYCEKNAMDYIEFSDDAIEALTEYDWPGNIRELKNQVERMIILAADDRIELSDLSPVISNVYYEHSKKQVNQLINSNTDGKLESFDVYEKEIYKRAYEMYGSFNAAGKALGVTHKTVASKLRKYNII